MSRAGWKDFAEPLRRGEGNSFCWVLLRHWIFFFIRTIISSLSYLLKYFYLFHLPPSTLAFSSLLQSISSPPLALTVCTRLNCSLKKTICSSCPASANAACHMWFFKWDEHLLKQHLYSDFCSRIYWYMPLNGEWIVHLIYNWWFTAAIIYRTRGVGGFSTYTYLEFLFCSHLSMCLWMCN